jgi:hypothetical protein
MERRDSGIAPIRKPWTKRNHDRKAAAAFRFFLLLVVALVVFFTRAYANCGGWWALASKGWSCVV